MVFKILTVIIDQGHLIITHQHPGLRQPEVPNLIVYTYFITCAPRKSALDFTLKEHVA